MTLNGALRKSSRSLSHLLMSSCPILSALLLGSSSSGRHQTLRRMVQIRNGIAELLHRAPPILTADTLNVICDFLNQYIQFHGFLCRKHFGCLLQIYQATLLPTIIEVCQNVTKLLEKLHRDYFLSGLSE